MNEVLAPIYYVFCQEQQEPEAQALEALEADAFFCFTNLMAEVYIGLGLGLALRVEGRGIGLG